MTPNTCSKENGQRLRELGVTRKSAFSWLDGQLLFSETHNTDGCIPAYLVGELGEMLERIWYSNDTYSRYGVAIEWFNCPDILADIICEELENGHASAEKINAAQ